MNWKFWQSKDEVKEASPLNAQAADTSRSHGVLEDLSITPEIVVRQVWTNPVVHAAINRLADACSTVPLGWVDKDGEMQEKTPDVLREFFPPSELPVSEKIRQAIRSYLLFGFAFIQVKRRTSTDTPMGSIVLPAADYQAETSPEDGSLQKLVLTTIGTADSKFNREIKSAALKEIILMVNADGYGDNNRAGTLGNEIARVILTYNATLASLQSFMESGFASSMVLFPPIIKSDTNERVVKWDKGTISALKDAMGTASTATKTGSAFIIDQPIASMPLRGNPREAQIQDVLNQMAGLIAINYGVPPQLLSIKDYQATANLEQATLSFYRNSVFPLLHRFESFINQHLKREYPKIDYYAKFKLGDVDAIQNDRVTRAVKLHHCSMLTDKEKRAEIGYNTTPAQAKELIEEQERKNAKPKPVSIEGGQR